MAGVKVDRERRKQPRTVFLTSPNGTEIEVTAERAENLLSRPPVQRGDGSWHKYAEEGQDTLVSDHQANQALIKALKKDSAKNGGDE